MLEFLKNLLRATPETPTVDEAIVKQTVRGQHRAESRLRESEEQFGKLVSSVRDYAVFLLDRDGTILTWNTGAEYIKGFRAEEIIGQNFSRLYPKEAASSGWPAHELRVAAATGRFEDEGWRVRKDGSLFWANVVITALRDDSGEVRAYLKITRDLTDRKQAEEKLRMSEERFRLLVEGVKDYAIFMLDTKGQVATWNEGAKRLKGYNAEEIIGKHFSHFYPQEAIERGWPDEELRRANKDGRFEDEGWRVRKDGSLFWANVVITALRDGGGLLHGYAKVTRDLTERREAEANARRLLQEEAARKAAEESAQEIERQREQLHVTLSSIGDAVIVTDRNGAVTFLNPVAVELTGWGLQEAAGKPLEQVFRIINEETRRPFENPVTQVFRARTVIGLANHTVLVNRKGQEVPVKDSAAPIRGKGDQISGAVLVFRDVTESRRAMETRLQLAAIVESSDDAIIGQGLDGTISSWNQGAERLYQYTAAEIVGKPLSTLVPPEHSDEIPAILERIARGEFIEHFETVRVRKDGTHVDVSLTISPIRNSEGKIIAASKIAHDITARKEEQRRNTEFIALLAHELRNPLAPLRNGLQVMRLAAQEPQAVEHARTMMERQLHHVVRLVDDLLDVSRISQGKLELRKERLSVTAVVENTLDVCGAMVKEQKRELIVKMPEEKIYLDADKTRLAQTLCNLLNNAVKYSDRGSRIWLTAERQGNEAVFRVKDNGIGIPPQMLPKVFDLFTQVDRTLEKSQGGLGVGLTIVKRLIEMHGGSVEAHSEGYGKGSEFVIRLPVAQTPIQERQQGFSTPSALSETSRHRILVADNNVDAADSLALMLRMMGHEVQTAHNGKQAVEAAESFRPGVILLDIGMPKLNGYEACRSIREQSWGNDAFLIALTGWGQNEDKVRSQEAGFDYHLVKPVEPAALEKLLVELK